MLSLALLLPLSTKVFAVNCEKELEKHLTTDLNLSYQEFDQTPGSGMRVLSSTGCHVETAKLIESYIEHNNATQSSLRWHIAQQYAMADERLLAIEAAKTTLKNKNEITRPAFKWNDYVLATIAFLEKDKDKLVYHTNIVLDAADAHFGNELNGKLLSALIKHFDKNYAYATSRID